LRSLLWSNKNEAEGVFKNSFSQNFFSGHYVWPFFLPLHKDIVLMKWFVQTYLLGACVLFVGCNSLTNSENKPLNILIITLDDMAFGTTGVEGCSVPGITPNIDKLASEGMIIYHGFVTSPLCGPSRSSLLSGRYPHCNGVMGNGRQPPELWQQPLIITPVITRYLKEYGYSTGAIFKNSRAINNVWDISYQEYPYGVGYHDRNPDSFYQRTKSFISSAKKKGNPFFLYANPVDPHRPWTGTDQEKQMLSEWNPDNPYPPSRQKYSAEEIEIPDFLPDLPEIRDELVPYYEALSRGDECIGAILKALEESGEDRNTFVVFLSDNGMGAIGAKSSLYQAGIRTPIIVKWPGKIKQGTEDDQSVISNVDIVPTLLDATGLPGIEGLEGKSILNVLTGENSKAGREYAYAASNYFAGSYLPSRAIIDKEFCYIWNAYVLHSDGEQKYPDYWIDIVQPCLNGDHPELSERVESILNKSAEEMYDLTADPGCWNNLAENRDHLTIVNKYRNCLLYEMESTNDPEWQLYNQYLDESCERIDFVEFASSFHRSSAAGLASAKEIIIKDRRFLAACCEELQ
jgi:N-sulfoglucosamine sulfohydrolase